MGKHVSVSLAAALGLALGAVSTLSAADPTHSRFSGGESRDSGHWEHVSHETGALRWNPAPRPSAPAHFKLAAPAPRRQAGGGDDVRRPHDRDWGGFEHDWGDGDIRHFHDHDWDDWRQGHWVHEWNDGVFGWWFVASGIWFWYPVPVYPYPDPYVPPAFLLAPPPASAPADAPQYWYYCPASNGYYPYVSTCPSGWQQVPATPDSGGPPSPDDGGDSGS